ncbi:gp15 [Bacillus phage G]|uniref:Gp15 n=1 Tax=Bacillus phage G TaxID=2884420 RepID=G3MB85_9CAUD|nr:gp15 [Bacillus phage G]AEO93286.1 gp15 [Bacillus phage G]
MLERMGVSKMVKQYILSIDSEMKEYFGEKISLLENQMKDVFSQANLAINNSSYLYLIENFIKDILDTSISLIDYYVDGIYNSGKTVSRKKLKLQKQIPDDGERYAFTDKDKLFIEKYKSEKLVSLQLELQKAIFAYIENKLSNEIDNNDSKVIDLIKEDLDSSYEEIIDILVREILMLFKRSQIEEYKNLNIKEISIITEDESLCCPVCIAKSNKILKIDEVINDFGLKDGNHHSFCNYSLDPIISLGKNEELNNEVNTNIDFNILSLSFKNVPIELEYRINKLVSKFKIYGKKYLREIEFNFVKNITEENDWFNSVKSHYSNSENKSAIDNVLQAQDDLKDKTMSFDFNDKCYISINSLDYQSVEEIITRKLMNDSLVIDNWVTDRYQTKIDSKYVGNGIVIYQDPFVNQLAQDSPFDYLLESIIVYVNKPKQLEVLDKEIFDYIKEKIFNGIQFFK